ncbi:MAG: pilus assembly protein PilM, partial [Candidatus Omnitrophota bacterium]
MKTNVVLEIGEQHLKMALSRPLGPRQSKLFDCITEPITSFTDDQITKAVSELFKKLKMKPQPLTVSIPRNFVTVRNLHLPSKDKKEITQMIDLHIPRIVPYRKEEVVFDHKFLGTDEMGYAKELLGIVHGGAIRRQAKILEDAGMSIDRFTLGSYGAWQRILNDCKADINPNDIYLLLDVDSTFTDFIIFSHENLLFTRSIAVGANEMMENMQASLKKLLSDARQSLIIFYSEELNRKPVKIFISGADVLNEMYGSIETELSIPVKSVTLPYSEDMVKAKGRTIPRNLSLSAVTEIAVEESQKGLTFILPEIQIRKALKEKTRELTIMGTLIIYILTISLAIFLGRSYNQQS